MFAQLYREVADRARPAQQPVDLSMHPQIGRVPEPQLSYKPRGLVKKVRASPLLSDFLPEADGQQTITVRVDGSDYHLIAYYTPEDVAAGVLRRPTSRPDLMTIDVPPELTRSTNFRYPPDLEKAQETVGSRRCVVRADPSRDAPAYVATLVTGQQLVRCDR